MSMKLGGQAPLERRMVTGQTGLTENSMPKGERADTPLAAAHGKLPALRDAANGRVFNPNSMPKLAEGRQGLVMHPGDAGYKPAFIKSDHVPVRNPELNLTKGVPDFKQGIPRGIGGMGNGLPIPIPKGEGGHGPAMPFGKRGDISSLKPGDVLPSGQILGPDRPRGGAHGGILRPGEVANPNYNDGPKGLETLGGTLKKDPLAELHLSLPLSSPAMGTIAPTRIGGAALGGESAE